MVSCNLGEYKIEILDGNINGPSKSWFYNYEKGNEWVRGELIINYYNRDTLNIINEKDSNIIKLSNK